MKDETSELDLVGPTLQALKALLDRPVNLPDPDNKFGRIVHGLLSACLINIDEMRYVTKQQLCSTCTECTISGREGTMCNKKIKCNLLAAVLVLTVLPATVPVGRPIIEHACFLISQKLVEGGEVRHDRGLDAVPHDSYGTLGLIDSRPLRKDAHHGLNVWPPDSPSMHQATLAGLG